MIDQGTGCVASLATGGIAEEFSLIHAVKSGASLVCSSGDKLLGGPQCGLVIGDRVLVRRMRDNPLYRALRVDKLTLAALSATLDAYLSDQENTIPVLAMLAIDPETIRKRCEAWARSLASPTVDATVVPTESAIGGGTAPGAAVQSFAVALMVRGMSAGQIAASLRRLDPPIISRIHEGHVMLDLRTVPESADGAAIRMMQEAFEARPGDVIHARRTGISE
jgi:L-seryl-tRNA(Ser) seleniumtransferase